MILNVLREIDGYGVYVDQIEKGLIKRSYLVKQIPNYYHFVHDVSILRSYEKRKESYFKLSAIKVFDDNGTALSVSLYFAYGLILGYELDSKIDRSKGLNVVSVDISKVKRIELDTDYFNKISKLLSTQEAELINKSDVYPTSIGRIDYYHLVELEDGDFVGITIDGLLFKIPHDGTMEELNRDQLMSYLKGSDQ